jgi:hypothetical protein
MDKNLHDLLEILMHSDQKICISYEKEDGTIASMSNGDNKFMNKVYATMVCIRRGLLKRDVPEIKAQILKNRSIQKDSPVVWNEDSDVEKTFTIN